VGFAGKRNVTVCVGWWRVRNVFSGPKKQTNNDDVNNNNNEIAESFTLFYTLFIILLFITRLYIYIYTTHIHTHIYIYILESAP